MTTAKKILTSYKKHVPKPTSTRRKKAERVLGQKLCRCIKKLGTKFEARSIGICTKTIFGKRGLTRGKFQCKKKQTVKYKKKKNEIS
jgi:hypothetical protein